MRYLPQMKTLISTNKKNVSQQHGCFANEMELQCLQEGQQALDICDDSYSLMGKMLNNIEFKFV